MNTKIENPNTGIILISILLAVFVVLTSSREQQLRYHL